MLEEDLQKAEWKIKQAIAAIILQVGGVIFGGFVRDTLLHDHFARQYYEKMEGDAYGPAIQKTCYSDETVFPETNDRLLIPNDIDCYIENTEMLARLESAFKTHMYSFHRVFLRQNASQYLPRLQVPDHSLLHIRYKVDCLDFISKNDLRNKILSSLPLEFRSLCSKEIQTCLSTLRETSKKVSSVTLDVLVKRASELIVEPPFGNIDFECNALLLTKDGIRVSNQLSMHYGAVEATGKVFKLTQIIQDIIRKKAVIPLTHVTECTIDRYRFQKMVLKEWKVDLNLRLIQEIPMEPPPDEKDVCTICLSPFETNYYKLSCCETKYHKQCLVDSIRIGPAAMQETLCCIVCKRKTIGIGREGTLLSYV